MATTKKAGKTNMLFIFLGVGVVLAILTAIFIDPSKQKTETSTSGGTTTSNEGLLSSIGDFFKGFDFGKKKDEI